MQSRLRMEPRQMQSAGMDESCVTGLGERYAPGPVHFGPNGDGIRVGAREHVRMGALVPKIETRVDLIVVQRPDPPEAKRAEVESVVAVDQPPQALQGHRVASPNDLLAVLP